MPGRHRDDPSELPGVQLETIDVFAALASPVRRELIRLLRDVGPLPVEELASEFQLTRPTVSEHLKVLRDAGLVTEQRHGRQRIYQLEAGPLLGLRDWLAPYEQFWRERLADFAALVDEAENMDEAVLVDEAALADQAAPIEGKPQ